jgi:hypothetical protein
MVPKTMVMHLHYVVKITAGGLVWSEAVVLTLLQTNFLKAGGHLIGSMVIRYRKSATLVRKSVA